MKLPSWMKRKVGATAAATKHNSIPPNSEKGVGTEEFGDWRDGLLAIGTLGVNNFKQLPDGCHSFQVYEYDESSSSIRDRNHPNEDNVDHLSSLEEDSASSNDMAEKEGNHLHGYLDDNTRSDQTVTNNNKSDIGKKSFSFLMKKVFLCHNGFAPAAPPTPSLRDPLPKSTMEKILKSILNKKIYPQSSMPKKYLDNKCTTNINNNTNNKNETSRYTASDGSKWVKTDSEYIVLEI